MPQTKTTLLAALFALTASAATAQTAVGNVVNLDPGASGGSAGLISGGGLVSSSLDARPASSPRDPVPQARRDPAPQARAEARTNARAEADIAPRAKKSKNQPSSSPERVYRVERIHPGFSLFGSRRYSRTRD